MHPRREILLTGTVKPLICARELDCVTDEVRQNRAELVCIADQAIGRAGLDSK